MPRRRPSFRAGWNGGREPGGCSRRLEFPPARRHLPFDVLREGAVADQNLLQGTLDMLVLKTLRLGPMHGWGIAERIESGSRRILEMNEGSLYPALYRLERQRLIRSEWGTSEKNSPPPRRPPPPGRRAGQLGANLRGGQPRTQAGGGLRCRATTGSTGSTRKSAFTWRWPPSGTSSSA